MKSKLRKIALATLIGCLILMAIAVPVLAAYYADISVVNSTATAYAMYSAQVPLNVTYLDDNGYFTNAEGLDTRVHAGIHPHMLASDRLMFALPVPATSSNILEFTTGNAALSAFHIIIGQGGSVSVADHAELELSDGFEVEIKGWVNTATFGVNQRLIYKLDAFRIYVVAADTIRVSILQDASGDVEDLGLSTAAVVPSGEYTITASADGVNLRLVVINDAGGVADVNTPLAGNSVPDNNNAWYFMQNNTLPYVEYITIEATDW